MIPIIVTFTFIIMLIFKNDGVEMGSPLGPILANIFMVEVESSAMLTLI